MSSPMALSPTVDEWQEMARVAIASAAAQGPFTTEDLEEWIGPPPNRNGWQQALNRAVNRRHIAMSNWRAKSRKPSRRGAQVCVYIPVKDEKEDNE